VGPRAILIPKSDLQNLRAK